MRDPLSQDELTVRDGLVATITHLSKEIGERHRQESWQLSEAADYLAAQITERGFAVERQGYELDDVAAHNLSLTVQGGERGDQVLILGASYDSLRGEPGENAGGAEVAALLELARLMRGARLVRSLRIVFYAMGKSPLGDGEARGSRHYSRALAAQIRASSEGALQDGSGPHLSTIGAVQLSALGTFSSQTGKSGPIELDVSRSPGSEKLFSFFKEEFSSPVYRLRGVESASAPSADPAGSDSDGAAFLEQGIPSVTFTGTAAPAPIGSGTGGSGTVQVEDLARVVMRIRAAIGAILGEKPTNDQMLTPQLHEVR